MTFKEFLNLKVGDYILYNQDDLNIKVSFLKVLSFDNILNICYVDAIYCSWKYSAITKTDKGFRYRCNYSGNPHHSLVTDVNKINYYYKLATFI